MSGQLPRNALGKATAMTTLTSGRPRSAKGKKEVGVVGQASFASSVINLVNTSESSQTVNRARKGKAKTT